MKLLLAISILFSCYTFGQNTNYDDSLVTIKGRVIDTNFAVGFYNLVVVNKTVGMGIFGDYNGEFSITVKKSDQVGISVTGYKTIYVSYKDSSYNKVYKDNFYIQTLEFVGNEVIVKPLKTLEELQEERASIAKREVPTVTVVNAIESPITALYVAFSKREKTKRLVAELEFQDKQDEIVREILRVYVHNDIFDLPQENFEEFIRFLNLNTDFLKSASDYQLITYIKGKYEHFLKIKEGF